MTSPLQPGQIVTGNLFNEPMRIETVAASGMDTWAARKIFTKRIPHTAGFQIDGPEFILYQDITRFVKQQSAKAAIQGEDPRARAIGFSMSSYLVEKLKAWGFKVGFIHGSMKPGACYYSLQQESPVRIDFYRTRIVDGLG